MPTVDVRLVDVVKRYGEAVVVDHINLEVQTGEFFTLLGPSGCGKTTTLRMIGGFEAPTSGLIELKGEDVTWLPPYKRHVNTVFQNYALFPHLTIYENVAFGLRRTKVSDSEIKTRVTDMLKLVELPGYERRKPTQLSGGQAQRVALARALINRPSVLLLDEPLGALDLKLRKQMQIELKRIQQEVGITFIFVTHDQEEAMTMSDRIAVMNHGHYEQLGEPATLYERPKTRFVAGFLGVSNLLPTTPEGKDGDFAVSKLADGSAVRVPAALTEGLTSYEIGVRPEKIRLLELKDEVPAGYNQMLGTVSDVSYLGVSTSYIVETKGGGSVTVYEQNVQRATRSELWEPGEEVRLVFSPTHTFAVEAGGEPPPDVPVAGLVAAGAPVPPPPAGISRRKFVVGGAIAVVAVGFGAFLASTAGSGIKAVPSASTALASASPPPKPSTEPSAEASASASAEASAEPVASLPPATGTLRFANWEGYMDIDDKTKKFPTIEKFTKETGIKVDYVEVIDGNETFFTAQLAGPLGANLPTEWDLMVLTDWMIGRLIRLGWLETLDPMPNFPANLLAPYIGRSFDPNTNLAAPYQSGMTGIMMDQNKTGKQTSLAVLFSDQFAKKKTFLDEWRDTIGLSALHLGFDPGTLTQDQFDQSLALVGTAVTQGWVRQIKGNSYTEDMAGGGAVLAMGWSGDLYLIQPGETKSQDFQWVLASEGGMLWTDNMAIPKGTPNKLLAEHWIDFYYDPKNAATIEAYVNYVCPVKGAREVMLETNPDIANNPLIFPPADWIARLHQFRDTTAEEETAWAEAFTKATGF